MSMKYPYRDLGVPFDRKFRNDLNANFDDIEHDIRMIGGEAAQQALEAAHEAETQAIYAQTSGDYAQDKGDYAAQQGDYAKTQGDYAKAQGDAASLAIENANAAIENANTAIENANAAIENANTAVENANNAAASANDAATNANSAATNANNAADNANTQATNAQDAAQAANDAAQAANQAADNANLAATNATNAANDANIAANNANLASERANNEANYAKEQGDYAKEQGDYAKEQGDYAKEQGDYAKEQGDYAKEQGDYAKSQAELIDDILEQGPVVAVNGKTGNIILTAEDVGAIPTSEKGVAGGVARLNEEGKVVDASGNEVEGKVKSVNGKTGDVQITSGDIHNIDPLPVTAYATAYPTGHSVMFIPANHEYSVGWRESLGLGTSINWYFVVEYFKTSSNNGYQKVTAYRIGSNLPNVIFMRNSTGSTSWNNWKRIFTSDDITDSTTTDDSTKVASAKAVKTVNDNLTQLQQIVNEHLADIASTDRIGHVIVDNFGLRVDENGVLSLKNNEVINLTINSNSDIKKVLESIPQGVAARVIVSETSEDNPIVIDQPIYLMGKNILLYSTSKQYVRVTAPIYLINSFFSFNNFDIHADGVIFQASGISGLMCGAYFHNRIYPLTATSNVSFLRMRGLGNSVLTNPSLISVNLLRTTFATDNFFNYSGTFKVFDRYDVYNAQILLSRQWEVTLQPNVSWGLTEYTLAGNLKYYQ